MAYPKSDKSHVFTVPSQDEHDRRRQHVAILRQYRPRVGRLLLRQPQPVLRLFDDAAATRVHTPEVHCTIGNPNDPGGGRRWWCARIKLTEWTSGHASASMWKQTIGKWRSSQAIWQDRLVRRALGSFQNALVCTASVRASLTRSGESRIPGVSTRQHPKAQLQTCRAGTPLLALKPIIHVRHLCTSSAFALLALQLRQSWDSTEVARQRLWLSPCITFSRHELSPLVACTTHRPLAQRCAS